jgi:hypothetical protein
MPSSLVSNAQHLDVTLVKLAREIALDIFPLDEILNRYEIMSDRWETLKDDPVFTRLLSQEVLAWNSATNTEERVKLKAAAMIEDFLPEAHAKLHSTSDLLSAKVELFKTIARLAGMGLSNAAIDGAGGEKFSITINLGADAKLNFEKVTPKVIDATPVE